ncbi:MAG: hypothetical protein DMG05_29775 [Acidobacteria bacterium]|nr:MAG: hypothetical protein DMG05_29775 [Acidobacteriota bacterium]
MGFTGGYSDLKLDENTFRINFRGNGYTSSERVEIFALYRCAEVTLQRGFDYFVIVQEGTQTSQYQYNTPGSYSSTTTVIGSTAYTRGNYTPGASIPVNKHRAAVTIKAYKGTKSDIPGAYMAKELMKNLAQQIPDLPAPAE